MSCEGAKPVDTHRAVREFERFMREINPDFTINGPGEERMTLEERLAEKVRTRQRTKFPPGRLVAIINYYPDAGKVEITRI